MKFLLYQKSAKGDCTHLIKEYDPSGHYQLARNLTESGVLILVAKSTYHTFSDAFKKMVFLNCGNKKEKIDLYRSLKFHLKHDNNHPRKLIFNTINFGALKRSILAFITNRLQIDSPASLVFVPDDLFLQLIKELQKKPDPKYESTDTYVKNPIKKLISDSLNDPISKKLSESYLGTSVDIQLVRALIIKAAQSKSPVLILGESGTGKEVIARLIYDNSHLNKECFTVINCSALPEGLIESELFGSKKGSYSGSVADNIGLFAASNGGTVFLDEIGELSLVNQAKILLAVENQTIRQVGSTKSIDNLDVRIIAATNRNIDEMVTQKTFRDDLLYRLHGIRIHSPALCSHPDDIPILASHIWSKLSTTHQLSTEFKNYLKTYSWPGNVRELKTTLNSIRDIFGDISPNPNHIEAIRIIRHENMDRSNRKTGVDKSRLLWLEAYDRLINVQNILRAVKIELRPYINQLPERKAESKSLFSLREFLFQQINLLEEICREPIYFNDYDLFKETTRYRYLLDKTLENWPRSLLEMHRIWNQELSHLEEDINKGIHKFVWGNFDR